MSLVNTLLKNCCNLGATTVAAAALSCVLCHIVTFIDCVMIIQFSSFITRVKGFVWSIVKRVRFCGVTYICHHDNDRHPAFQLDVTLLRVN